MMPNIINMDCEDPKWIDIAVYLKILQVIPPGRLKTPGDTKVTTWILFLKFGLSQCNSYHAWLLFFTFAVVFFAPDTVAIKSAKIHDVIARLFYRNLRSRYLFKADFTG